MADSKSRIRFLSTSAQAYCIISPNTSAYLMSECQNIANNYNPNSTKQLQTNDVCKACGTIFIESLTSKSKVTPLPKPRKPPKAVGKNPAVGSEKQVQTQCLRCHRSTTVLIPASVRNKPAPFPSTISSESGPCTSYLANRSSKTRTRARKQGGLQAMLEKSKSKTKGTVSPQAELDIMDFMIKS